MDKLKMHSPDLSQENIEKMRSLFPNCVTEANDENGNLKLAIDFDQLKQELSDSIVEGPQERYQLNWPGKRQALLKANAPLIKTFRPCPEESVNFDTTENLFIEGDNIEALKLLQESYLGKVKTIYIDPPYNTGNDFIYEDDFAESADEFDLKINAVDSEGRKLFDKERWKQNSEANGRFHSDWLSNLYSRLKLSRNLLTNDGVIFCSIDDNEQDNLKKLLNEVFGEQNFVGNFIWKSRQNKDNRNTTGASIDHEYVLCYSKDSQNRALRGSERNLEQYKNPDNDVRGDWASGNMVGLLPEDQRPNCHYDLINPSSGINYGKPEMGWRYDNKTMSRLIAEDRILWPSDPSGRPRRKVFLKELKDRYTGFSSMIGQGTYTRHGSAEVETLIGKKLFDFPKPTDLIVELLEQTTNHDDIVLDFYSGSGSTAHSVLKLNSKDGGNRKFIAVQIPEPCKEKSAALKAGFENIADISKYRIKEAGKRLLDSDENNANWNRDVGFRVLKIDSSNMTDVFYRPDQVNQADMFAQVENIKEDRTDEDLLFQVLLDWGVGLTLPISKQEIASKEVFLVNADEDGEGADLIACFSTNVANELIKELAEKQPLRVVFRDDGFANDSVKINVEQIFKQISPMTDVKSI